MFADLGATVVSADQLAREVVAPGSATLQALIEVFGPSIVDTAEHWSGRRWRNAYSAMRRPVRSSMPSPIRPSPNWPKRACRNCAPARSRWSFYEAPLLFEAGPPSASTWS